MKVNVQTDCTLTPKELAFTLSHASPEDFAEFWHELNQSLKDDKLYEFARYMGKDAEYTSKKMFFRKFERWLSYFEHAAFLEKESLTTSKE